MSSAGDIIKDLKLEISANRSWLAAGNIKNHRHFSGGLEDFSLAENLTCMVIMQDGNMGGNYWRYFSWFDGEISSRNFTVSSWISQDVKPLIEWVEDETVTIFGRDFVVNSLGGVYKWSLIPIR